MKPPIDSPDNHFNELLSKSEKNLIERIKYLENQILIKNQEIIKLKTKQRNIDASKEIINDPNQRLLKIITNLEEKLENSRM